MHPFFEYVLISFLNMVSLELLSFWIFHSSLSLVSIYFPWLPPVIASYRVIQWKITFNIKVYASLAYNRGLIFCINPLEVVQEGSWCGTILHLITWDVQVRPSWWFLSTSAILKIPPKVTERIPPEKCIIICEMSSKVPWGLLGITWLVNWLYFVDKLKWPSTQKRWILFMLIIFFQTLSNKISHKMFTLCHDLLINVQIK